MAGDAIQTSGGGADPINVNYTVQTETRPSSAGTTKMAMAMTKPAMIGAGVLALGTAALGVFDIFRVPGLEDQIKELEAEVDRLEGEVDRLSGLNDDYEQLNDELEAEVDVLATLNDQLNETTTQLEASVVDLTLEVIELNQTSAQLEANGVYFEQLNVELTQTQADLEESIVVLQGVVVSVNTTNEDLKGSIEDLNGQVANLTSTTEGLNASIVSLRGTVDEVSQVNSNLEQSIATLNIVTDYMNNVHNGFSQSLDTVRAGLEINVALTRSNTFKALGNFYQDLMDFWFCANEVLFGDFPFWADKDAPIRNSGSIVYGQLLAELNKRMLKLMCLNFINFENYIFSRFGSGVTYNQFTLAASDFGILAMTHYGLPRSSCTSSDCKVTEEEWENAEFNCENVTPYVWTPLN